MKTTQRRMARPSLGGLLATRQGALILALLCAVCAAGILMFALGKYKSGIKTVTPQATVLVATGSIPKGTAGAQIAGRGLYKSMPIVASQLAPGALGDASFLVGKTTSVPVLPGQQLTVQDFTGVLGVSGLLTPNQRAISLAIQEAPGNTDVLLPGDHVDLYAVVNAGKGPEVVLLDPNVPVIKVAGATASTTPSAGGTSSTPSTATTTGSGTTPAPAGAGTPSTIAGGSLVLAVSAQVASNIVFTATNATLYLTLRPEKSTATPRPLTTVDSVIKDSVANTIPIPPGGVK